jgi:pyrophosphatase PpaX
LSLPYRAILFDFDGTLTPSLPLWVKAFHIALREYDVELTDQEVIERLFFRDWNEAAASLRVPTGSRFAASVHRGLRTAFQEAVLYPAILGLMERCRDAGLRIALVTSAPRLVLDESLPRMGLAGAFDTIVCADDVQQFKPHPEPVNKSLRALDCAPEHALMVGDSSADILSGKAAGTATALYLTDAHQPYYSLEKLRATEPDHIFADHVELPRIIGLRE